MSATTLMISPTFGNVFFDAVLSTEHSGTVTPTKHPVQYGASITDHAINEPDEVMLSVGMSDSAVGVDPQHCVNAFSVFKAIKDRRELVTLVTRLHTYQNMLITSLSVPDDYTTMHALKASLILTQMTIATVSVVTVQQTVSSSKTSSSSSSSSSSGKKKKKPGKTGNKTPVKPTGNISAALQLVTGGGKTLNKLLGR